MKAHHFPLTGLANHLIDDGLLDENSVKQASYQAKTQNLPFVSYLIKNKILNSRQIIECCAKHFGLPMFDLTTFQPNEANLNLLDKELIFRYRIIPLDQHGQTLQAGIVDPSDRSAIDAITFHTGLTLDLILISEDELNELIEKHYQLTKNEALTLNVLHTIDFEEPKITAQENSTPYDEPIIQFVDYLLRHAQQQSASDIHIEPYEHACRIRYRQDGILYEIAEIQNHLASRVITRLKVMANLDISERRLPQDGRLQINTLHHKLIDVRINTCPTLHGEKIVLRLLDNSKVTLDINHLGLTDSQKKLFLEKITEPQGLILATGPTGSGKTVTLYSALDFLNSTEKNISTIEDPVEIQLTGINQVHINSKAGLHFATALRTFLRQDPDIIMVGEMRDTETAEIAIQAAQTGHLVLSTLHTNNAVETLLRLMSMGIAPYHVAHTVSLIIAQRLVRKLCDYCKQAESISAKVLSDMGFKATEEKFYRAYGCHQCRQGYRGRVGIFECLPLSEKMISLILKKADAYTLLKAARDEGFITLKEAGYEKALQGHIGLTELNRILRK